MASFVQMIIFIMVIIGTVYGLEEASEISMNVIYKPGNCNRAAKAGDFISLTYVGFLPSGSGNEQFDTSDNKGPVHFKLHDPMSTAMLGWHQGIEGMCIDEKRELIIPHGPLTVNHKLPNTKTPPEGRDVGYHIHVRNIQDQPPASNLFRQMDTDSDQKITKEEMKSYFSATGLGGMRDDETLDQAIENIFTNSDHDRSGTLTKRELLGHDHDEL